MLGQVRSSTSANGIGHCISNPRRVCRFSTIYAALDEWIILQLQPSMAHTSISFSEKMEQMLVGLPETP